ncbi:MAG: IS200/IS605 family transposase [Armatimonadota bacterium]
MPGSFASLHYHLVFCTKNRQPLLPPDFSAKVYAYMAGILRNIGGHALRIGGVDDHVHLLVRLPKDRAVTDTIRDLKANSSRWIRQQEPPGMAFNWQEGYAIFTVSIRAADRITAYIDGQRAHHETRSLEDEVRAFCAEHSLNYDPRWTQ